MSSAEMPAHPDAVQVNVDFGAPGGPMVTLSFEEIMVTAHAPLGTEDVHADDGGWLYQGTTTIRRETLAAVLLQLARHEAAAIRRTR